MVCIINFVMTDKPICKRNHLYVTLHKLTRQAFIWINVGLTIGPLTHWGWDKTAAISKTIFSNAYLNENYNFCGLIYSNGLSRNGRQAIICSND